MDSVPDKQHAHELIERLDPSQISTAVRFLEFMLLDPVARSVATTPLDDEPTTQDDLRRLREGEEWFRQRSGRGIQIAGCAMTLASSWRIFQTLRMKYSSAALSHRVVG